MANPARPSSEALPLRVYDDLFRPFHESMKPRGPFRIGMEAEKFGVDAATGAAIPYEGARSIVAVLERLADRYGWTRTPEVPGGPLIALARDGASITLEPGGQLELSGAPLETIHATCSEMRGHLAELREISDELRIAWLGVGYHPFARQEDLTWVPKARYAVMRRYLPTRGTRALDMMRRTATVQANFDYPDEAGAMRMLRVALRLSPLVTALFANSPFAEGRIDGDLSVRGRVWLDVDPDRQGLLPTVLARGETFHDYVEWALDVPMFLFVREGEIVENTGQTFRSFLADGFAGHRATLADWERHLNALFPEVRLKRTLEVRAADSLPADLACAVPALWTGVLYDARALDEAEELVRDFSHDELTALRPEVARAALGARFRGRPLSALAERLVEISSWGLARRARLSKAGRDERVHLARLVPLVTSGRCPAEALLAGLDAADPELSRKILERTRI